MTPRVLPRVAGSPFVRPPWATPQSLWRQCVELPAEEPLTIQEALAYAGFAWADGDPREALMRGFISAARSKAEQDTGLAILTQTWDLYLTPQFSTTATILPILPPQATPLQSVTEVVALTAAGGVAVTGFDVLGPYPAIRLAPASYPLETEAFTVRVVAGWPTAAAFALEAPLLKHAIGLLTAHYATIGRDSVLMGTGQPMPFGYDELVAPYRLIWLP